MARTYEVVLDINGRLGNLQSAINSASRSLQGLGRSASSANALASRSTQRLQSQLSQLNRNAQAAARFRELNSSLSTFTQRTAQARQQANQLYADLARQERQVEQMRQSFQSLQTARANGQVSARAVAQGRQELRAAEQGLNQLRTQYNSAQSNAENLNSALRRQTSELNQLQSAFNNAGVNASNFARHEADVARQITQTQSQLARSQRVDTARQNLSTSGQDVFNAYGNFQGAIDTASSIISPITKSVDVYANFDETMSKVKAVTGVTGAAYDALKAKAKEMGAATQFSATEAAGAMVMLGKTGWSDQQILGGIKPLLQTAIAGGADLAATADIVSDTMSAFGQTAGQNMTTSLGTQMEATQRFADVFAATASNANTDINLMGETFKYAAATAGSLGYSIEDVALATGIMGNNAVKGSMAGTALNSIMTRLVAPPKEAANSLAALGINVKNADGTLKPFRQQLTELRGAFKNLSEAEKAEHAQKIAGTEAMKGFLAVMNTADADFDKLAGKIDNSAGATDRMAATMSNNLAGSRKTLEAATEGLQLDIGEVFEPAEKSLTQFATNAANSLAQFVQAHPQAVQAAGAIAAAIAGITVASAGFSLAVSGIRFISASFALAQAQATLAAGRVAAFWATMTAGSSASTSVNVINNLGTAFASAGRASMAFVFSPVGAALTALALAGLYCYTNWERVAPIFSNLASTLSGSLGGAIATLTPAFSNLINTVQRLGPALAVIGGAVFGAISVALTAITGLGATIISTLANVISTVINIFSGLGNIIASVLAGNWDGVWQGFTQAAQAAVDGVVNIVTGLFSGIGDTFSSIFSNIQSLIGGEVSANVSATQATAPESSPAIDTSQTQAQIDALGQSAQATADAQQNIAQVGQGITTFSTDLTALSSGLMTANAEIANVGTGLNTVNTEAAATGTNLNLVGTNATMAATEITNLQTNAAAASPALQQVQASATSASSGLSQIAGAASSAASGLSQISGAAGSVASALQAKAAQISSISISAPKVAANAKGGIYKQGAFLTTFAEKSPEAAIPLDNSARAKELWTQTGQALGTLPGNPPTPETPSKLTAEERKILNQAALEYQQTGRANLPAPTEQSSAEYRRRYEQNKKLQDAMKYLPQSTPSSSGNIFSGRVQTQTRPQNLPSQPKILPKILNPTPTFPQQKNLPAIKNLPPMTQTQPRQVGEKFGSLGNIFSGKIQTPNFNPTQNKIPSLENIFSGGVKLPQLPELPKADNIFSSLLEKVFPTDSAKNSANPVQSTPQITVNITIQGNADANTMREAGQVLAVDLRRELDTWWRDKKADEQRRSFV